MATLGAWNSGLQHLTSDGLSIQDYASCSSTQPAWHALGRKGLRSSYGSSFFSEIAAHQQGSRLITWPTLSSCSATFCTNSVSKSLAEAILEESNTERTEKSIHLFKGKKFRFGVIPATTPEESLAAASLRAKLFYPYPDFSPEELYAPTTMAELQKAHELASLQSLKTRILSEFSRDSKMMILGMKVTCLLAVCERSEHEALLFSLASREKEAASGSVTEPPEISWNRGSDHESTLMAIGTLDIHVGESLPGENLQGAYPQGDRPGLQRGYIFNLCVSNVARRRGVASAMMETAASMAQKMGLKVLYIHVATDNPSAAALYEAMGYIVEQEEDLAIEKRLNRCRRRLMKLVINS